MTAYLNDLYADFRASALKIVWPEVVGNNIYEAEHADLIPWEGFTTPYAVLLCEGLMPGEWGMDNLAYEAEVQIYYVDKTTGSGKLLRPKLELLRDQLLRVGLTVAQISDVTNLDWGNSLTPNLIFTEKGMAHRAGRLTAQCVMGETLE